MVNKVKVLDAVLAKLEEELRVQLKGQAAAAEGATHAEARAETKWDTCGLEQSYLARGLARQCEALAIQVEELRAFKPTASSDKPIGFGALIEIEMDGDRDLFFLLDCGGGTEAEVDGWKITVITPESPLGAVLLGKASGDRYTIGTGSGGMILSVE